MRDQNPLRPEDPVIAGSWTTSPWLPALVLGLVTALGLPGSSLAGNWTGVWSGQFTSSGRPISFEVSDSDVITRMEFEFRLGTSTCGYCVYQMTASLSVPVSASGTFSGEGTAFAEDGLNQISFTLTGDLSDQPASCALEDVSYFTVCGGCMTFGSYTSPIEFTVSPEADQPIVGLVASNDSPTEVGSPTRLTATITSGTGVSYAWAFGDGTTGNGAVVSHTYPGVGTFTAEVTASNSLGSDSASTTVTIVPEAEVPITSPGAYVYVVPAAAHVAGDEGTSWMSDLVAHNVDSQPAEVYLFFMKAQQDNSGEVGKKFIVQAGSSLRLADVVAQEFEEWSASGAILVGSNRPLIVSSRTYNNAPDGTYGQYIPGYSLNEAINGTGSVRLVQLTANSRYRTNLGVANLTDSSLAIVAELYDGPSSSFLGQRTYTVPPYGYLQESNVVERVTSDMVDDVVAVVYSTSASARYYCYASVVDNASGDPIFVRPLSTSSSEQYIPASAHAQGANQTVWRTDVAVFNATGSTATYRLDLLEAGMNNSSPQSLSFSLAGGASARHVDILGLFGFTGTAALRLTPQGGTFGATSRTYNDLGTETYGQYIPAATLDDAQVTDDEARLVQLAHSPYADSGFRTNIGVSNASGMTIVVAMSLYTGDGALLGTRDVTVEPFGYRQENNVFDNVTTSTLDDAYATVQSSTPGALYFAYASVVDNRSGDPIFIPAKVPSIMPAGVLYDNGPLVNSPGTGYGGADESVLQSTSLGMETLGFSCRQSADIHLAEDFEVSGTGWQIDTITLFAYQTDSSTSPTITGAYLQVWDGAPNVGSSTVVWGDLTTDRLAASSWSEIYRVSETTGGATNRPVMSVDASVDHYFEPGTYWIEWMLKGTASLSGPWAPPTTIDGETSTGNALQFNDGAWVSADDGGTGTPQGLPFSVNGTASGSR